MPLPFANPTKQQAASRIEALKAMATGAIAEPIAGLAGIYGLATGGAAKGARTVEQFRNALTYAPRDPSSLQALGTALAPITDRIEAGKRYMGDGVMDKTGSPGMATAAYIAPEVLATLLGARMSGVKGPSMAQMAERSAGPSMGSPGAQLGIFAGKGAKTADLNAMAVARTQLDQGADPRLVWTETGWMEGPDGQMRFEIDDSAAASRDYQFTPQEALRDTRFRAMAEGDATLRERAHSMAPYADKTKNQLVDEYRATGGEIVEAATSGNMDRAHQLLADRGGLDAMLAQMADRRYGPMSAYLKHGNLGQAYPDVYRMHTRIDPEMEGRGAYMPESAARGEQIALRQKPWASDSRSTALHELQHGVQRREGFATGGNPAAARAAMDGQQSAGGMDLSLHSDYALYQRLAGEAEARAVQKRMDYSPAQRRSIYPLDDYDVPLDELIIRGNR